MIPIEHLMLITALLLGLSIVSSQISLRLSVPALLLFLLVGMLAGSDGPGQIYFDDAQLSQTPMMPNSRKRWGWWRWLSSSFPVGWIHTGRASARCCCRGFRSRRSAFSSRRWWSG